MVNTSESADSAVTFGRHAMPAIGGGSESSARLEDSDTSHPTAETSSSGSMGERGRDRRSRVLSGSTPQVREETEQERRSRSPSRPASERLALPRPISPRTPTQRQNALIQSGKGKGAARSSLPAAGLSPVPQAEDGSSRPGAGLLRRTLTPVPVTLRPVAPAPMNGVVETVDLLQLGDFALPAPLASATLRRSLPSPRGGATPEERSASSISYKRSVSTRRRTGTSDPGSHLRGYLRRILSLHQEAGDGILHRPRYLRTKVQTSWR